METLTLTADRAEERADAFLARSVPGLTRSAAQRLLEEGAVTLESVTPEGGKPMTGTAWAAGRRLKAGASL